MPGLKPIYVVLYSELELGGRMSYADEGVLLSQVVVWVCIIGPIQLSLQAVMSGNSWRVPQKGGKHRTMGRAFDPKIHTSVGDGEARISEAYVQITEVHTQANSRRIVRVVPDTNQNFVVGVGAGIARRHRMVQHIEELDIRVVPGDGEALAHQPLLRIQHRVGADVSTRWNFWTTTIAFRPPKAAVHCAPKRPQEGHFPTS